MDKHAILKETIKSLLQKHDYEVCFGVAKTYASLDINNKSPVEIANLIHAEMVTSMAPLVPKLTAFQWFIQFDISADERTLMWTVEAFLLQN